MKRLLFVIIPLLYSSCSSHEKKEELITVQIIDRNGFEETISNKERLDLYGKVDFLTSQPYKMVTRVYTRDESGRTPGKLTSYHPNGTVKQYLELINGRARGRYYEWYPSGKLKIEAFVLEGIGKLTPDATISWIFDGRSRVFYESGAILAEMLYEKGKLSGESVYFHENGTIEKTIPYLHGAIHGVVKKYGEEGEMLEMLSYEEGILHGPSRCYAEGGGYSAEEWYEKGLLVRGNYYDIQGDVISSIHNGRGILTRMQNGYIHQQIEYNNGVADGFVKTFEKGIVSSEYHVRNNEKHGEEIIYRIAADGSQMRKLSIEWKEGAIHGLVTTWYPSGRMESQREWQANKKQGKAFAWYENGEVKLIEEYEKDRLVSGKYFHKNQSFPTSEVIDGSGIAVLFDENGSIEEKIEYIHGEPFSE